MRIVFQGDSITDAGRDRNDPSRLGDGYPKYAAEELRRRFPEAEFEFLNLGISGNRSGQLFDRIYPDGIALTPDVISILIGINDIWHRQAHVETTDGQFRENLRSTLAQIRRSCSSKIVVLSPYILDCDDKEDVRKGLETVIPIVRELAAEYADVFIPLDELFAEAMKTQPSPRFFSDDGIHPNGNGAAFIGRKYAEYVAELIADPTIK